ncbi:MAG: endonuclease/exonuclease/phosphatase family protein [Chloroflexota bacterium]
MPASSALLRLCSWNIHLGIERERILEAMGGNEHFRNLDLLLIQEASVHGHQPDAERMAAELGPDYRAVQRNVDHLHGRIRGLGLVWNGATFQLLSANLLPLPHLQSVMPEGARLARRHRYWLRPLRLRQRSALVIEGVASGKRVRLYDIHLSPIGFALQTQQLATILRDVGHREPCDLLVMAGDFNSLRVDQRRWTTWFHEREAEGFVNASQGVEWTFRSPTLPLRQKLDNALIRGASRPGGSGPGDHGSGGRHGGDALVCTSHSAELAGSDHLPLFVSVQF